MERITTTDITKKLKIPFGRLREWIVRDYIKPSFPSPGQGQAAEFTIEDVYKIKAFQHMIDTGITRETAAEYIKNISGLEKQGDSKCDAIIFTLNKNRYNAQLLMVTPGARNSGYDKFHNWIEYPDLWPKSFDDFDDIYVLNFKKIRESVDKAFR